MNRRRLYEKKGFGSIFEFAAKLAGLSNEQVRLALNLEKRFQDKPALKSLLVDGAASLDKLTRVVSIATVDNELALAEKVKQLPKSALETLVRDEKYFQANVAVSECSKNEEFENRNGLYKPKNGVKSLPGQTLNFELSQDLIAHLNELHAQGKDVNQLLAQLLKQRIEKIEEQKEDLSERATPTKSRYISAELRTLLKEEYGEKCSIKHCLRPAAELHHSQRFSLATMHDPKYLAPLCHEHHSIAHAVDKKVRAHWT